MADEAKPAVPVVSFENDIVPLFRPMDVQCMRARGTFLIDYEFMKNGVSEVMDYLTGTMEPRMPYGGPYWSDESIQLLQSWIDGGYTK